MGQKGSEDCIIYKVCSSLFLSTCRSVDTHLGDCCTSAFLPWTELWGSRTIQAAKLYFKVLLFPSAMVRWVSLLLSFRGGGSGDSDW